MKKGNVPAAVPNRGYLLRELADPAFAAAYLNAAVREADPAAFLQALRNVVDANGGITKIAARTDLNRQAVYRMLSENGNPEFRSLQSLLEATGLGLNVEVAQQTRAAYGSGKKETGRGKRKRRAKSETIKLAA
ncbi:MAG TPA: transcriptional regulator [Burkholderiales bacterium]|jgi:probable addiction module antidote protein